MTGEAGSPVIATIAVPPFRVDDDWASRITCRSYHRCTSIPSAVCGRTVRVDNDDDVVVTDYLTDVVFRWCFTVAGD